MSNMKEIARMARVSLGTVSHVLNGSANVNPALSSVSQSGYELGATAARILRDRINGDSGPMKHIVLETSLTIRDSVASTAGRVLARSS